MNRLIPILILVLGSIFYTSWRIWHILPMGAFWKTALTTLYVLCFLILFPHYMLGDRMPATAAAATYMIGTSWMIFFLYALLFFLVLDLGRLLHLIPGSFLKDSLAGTLTVFGAIVLLLVYGNVHYAHKYREVIEIQTEKPLEKPLVIVMASDLHAGYHIRKDELQGWADLINAEHPDLVLLAGDVLDGAIRPVREWHYEEVFRSLETPVYACPGNHEYISGMAGAMDFFEEAGIRMLRDSSVEIKGIRIVGRDDSSNPSRANLYELFTPDSTYTIVLDHQPFNLQQAQYAGADFQLSGHTHHGQIWPGNWLTDLMYEKAYGQHVKGSTRYYITSGMGVWGGKFRIGSRCEYVVLKLSNQL